MTRICCSYCGYDYMENPRLPGAGLYQSKQFPTIFLHHLCICEIRAKYRMMYENDEILWHHPLIDALTWWPT